MKKTVLSLTLLSATLFLGAARGEAPKAPATPALNAEETALLQRYDRNRDHRLDEGELAAAHESMLQENLGTAAVGARGKFRAALIRRFDRDGDGRLDATEQTEAKRVVLARFDTNHDGRLDEDERAEMRAAYRARVKELKARN